MKLSIITAFCFLLLVNCFIPFQATGQCLDLQFTTATLSSDDFGQSFTVPVGGCGTLTDLVVQRKDGLSNNLSAVTATFELFTGQTISGVAQYTQTGITISAGVGDKTITLGGGTGSLAVTAGAQYTWYLTLSASSDWQLGQGSSGDTYADGKGYLLSSFQSGFDMDMTLNSTSPPLPVELIAFDVKKEASSVLLTWETASEKNNEGFEIQRSTNGEQWETLDFVLGNGTTQELSSYEYIDENPLSGSKDFALQGLYYRLKQIDFDGQFEYSHVLNVEYQTENNKLRIFPNPVQDELNVIDGEGQATIYNTLGQPVKEFSINNPQSSINTSDLPKGQYILQIIKQNGSIQTQRFVK